ncbi:hypothetical protein [Zooshikella harenae]|uniref:Uncharacterized protein n=1 Tax=Zooshikella harenae TaxID=2827238 RepID=A0ABS5ZI92_9GAMM|nr:hypothetical protein [Zooshikella harenae]MBU2713796.1 hypothetical protein [Zooshikella harenae]
MRLPQWPTTAFKNGIPFQLGVFKFKLTKKYIERSEYYSNSEKSNPSAKNFSLILSENEGFTLSIKPPPPNVNAYNFFYIMFINSVKTQPFIRLTDHKKMQVIEAKSHILSKGNAKVISYSKGDFNTFKVIYTNIANYSMTYITHRQLQDQFLIIDNTLLTPSEFDKFIGSIELVL